VTVGLLVICCLTLFEVVAVAVAERRARAGPVASAMALCLGVPALVGFLGADPMRPPFALSLAAAAALSFLVRATGLRLITEIRSGVSPGRGRRGYTEQSRAESLPVILIAREFIYLRRTGYGRLLLVLTLAAPAGLAFFLRTAGEGDNAFGIRLAV